MLHYVEGNLFESPAQVLVNTVNTVGVMGKGIAKEFKRIYPEMFRQYRQLCESGELTIGKLWLYKTPHKWILNFPTKKHWRNRSKVDYIDAGLRKFRDSYRERGITSVAFPMLGCGNGELDWDSQVRPVMEKYLRELPIDVFVYLYRQDFTPEHRNPDDVAEWLRSEPADLPFAEVVYDIQEILQDRVEFTTYTGFPFRVQGVRDDEGKLGLLFSLQSNSAFLDNGQLFTLWQVVRDKGFLDSDSLPRSLLEYIDYVQAFFGELPYLRPLKVWYTRNGIDACRTTLQLVPPVRKQTVEQAHLEPVGHV